MLFLLGNFSASEERRNRTRNRLFFICSIDTEIIIRSVRIHFQSFRQHINATPVCFSFATAAEITSFLFVELKGNKYTSAENLRKRFNPLVPIYACEWAVVKSIKYVRKRKAAFALNGRMINGPRALIPSETRNEQLIEAHYKKFSRD